MTRNLDTMLASQAPAATILSRLMVGGVFLSEGIQKFLERATRGAAGVNRFAAGGLSGPLRWRHWVGATEIVCGLLVLLGLFTRVAAVPLIITMVVAIVTVKVPILLGANFWGFHLRELPSYGFWSMAHEARTDFAMLLGAGFLLSVGAGPMALDCAIRGRRRL